MKKWKKRGLICFAALFAGILMSHGLFEVATGLNEVIAAHAEGENVVSFASNTSNVDGSSNVIYADLTAKGTPGATVKITYRTHSGTAIENVDYLGVNNVIALTLDGSGSASYRIAVKCLNDAETRQKLRVADSNNVYGRYFHLNIVEAENASVGSLSTCKCYLPFSHSVSATTGIQDGTLLREVAYLNDYKGVMGKYHKGDNDISGKETWKTWKEGISFNNADTQRWVNTYINDGFANAYGTYILKSIDDDKLHSTSNIYMLSGNKEFMDKYSRSSSCPGLSLYYEIEPCKKGGHRIDGKAMTYISKNINPHNKDGDLVDLDEFHLAKNPRRIYWIQESDAWYSSKNTIYDTTFYKTEPYNGVLDYGMAIFNNNKSWDREVHNIWLFMALVDEKCPTITNQYSEYDTQTGNLRIYLRFNEPVYSSKKANSSLLVRINGYTTNYYANYAEGNYSDTLVYEIPAAEVPNVKITSVTYQLPTEDIGDLAYNLDQYKLVRNNLVQNTDANRDVTLAGGSIDLSRPQLSVDVASCASPKNIHNVMLSANANGATSFNTGTVYYSWDKNDYITNPTSPLSYASAHVLTSEEQGSFSLSLAKNESLGIDSGDYYLHALAVSEYGLTAHNTFGPYRLDGDAPEITNQPLAKDELKDKEYQLSVKAKPLGTPIDSVDIAFKYKDGEGVEQVSKRSLLKDGSIVTGLGGILSQSFDSDGTTYIYRSCIDEESSTPLDTFVLGIMGGASRLPVEVYFEVSDSAGNKAKSTSHRTIYDRRTLFHNTVTVPSSYVEDTSISISGATVFDISGASGTDGLTFEIADDDVKALVDEGATYSVLVNDEAEYSAGTSYGVTLSGLEPGHYTAVGRVQGMAGSTQVDLVTDAYSFYLTSGMSDTTVNKANANGNLVLSNQVFEIEDAAYYYFNTANSSVATHSYGATYNPSTGKYEGGSSTPTFSTSIAAKKYVKFMEYQDLEVISISDAIASLLNGGSGSTVYVKEAKETKTAQEGQLWIRYKKASWTKDSGSNGWAFYYYGEGKASDGINTNNLSANLAASIETVTNRIVSEGKERFLVGDGYTSLRTGAPYLASSQMHVSSESAEATRSGNLFVNPVTYTGDPDLFKNTVTVEGNQYPLATNLPLEIGASTSLFFKDFGGDVWNPIEAEDGTLLKNALADQVTGLYTIREYGDQGVGEFTVYLDRSLPLLNVTLNKEISGAETTLTLDGEVTTITAKNLVLDQLINEADEGAYVAIYKYSTNSLITVLYGDAIKGYVLSDGNYRLLVGDRSGNVVAYVVRTSDSSIELTVSENESQTAVLVRVDNRDSSEIYSYEVYLNENLIDNEFASSKIYRGSGVYRIEVIDIYGNTEVRTLTHEAPTPDLTWYYMNESGSYSVYDPSRPGYMALREDPDSPRSTYAFASTYVRVLIGAGNNEDVEFEVLGIDPGDYTYNATTGLLTINTLASWRLRVWYKGQPENDHTYVFIVDNSAPEISGNFMGTAFLPYVVEDEAGNIVITSTFNEVNADKYGEGDYVTLDTLRYDEQGEKELTFGSGDVISTGRAVLHFTDPSGIRSVTVTRNGQPVDMELNENDELIFTSYGTYVVTATDNLGNVRTFLFTNAPQEISSATVDGEIVGQDNLVYGNESLQIATQYNGTETILVQAGEESHTYEFHFDSGVLTYGQYVIRASEYADEDSETLQEKAAVYQPTGFVLDVTDLSFRRGAWYTAVDNEDFLIQVMIDADGHAQYKVCVVEKEIHVEARFDNGVTHLPNRYIANLSKLPPSITLLTGGEVVEKVATLDYIYITSDLSIDKSSVASSVVSIDYAYSETAVFGDRTNLYKDGEWLVEDFKGTEFGFYSILVTDIFGNQTEYLVNKIEAFGSVVNIYTLDGSSVSYYSNEGTIYANYAIELLVASEEVRFDVNGVITSGYAESGITRLYLSAEGEYHVRVLGYNGIFEDFDFDIHSDASFLYQDEWITGYNETALLRDRGYTNTLCDIVIGKDVVFVDMVVNNEKYVVLYDSITGSGTLDPNLLLQAIGRYGIGEYTVGFRNKYGDLVRHTVYYNNVPSIVLTRTISSDPNTYVTYDLGLALEKGFYSNNLLRFTTDSGTYVFTINGVEYSLDDGWNIEFSNAAGKGSFSYRVTFRDEYGNYVEFDAILYRDDVAFDSSAMKVITLNNVSYTQDDVYITFGESQPGLNLKATLSIDGGEAKDYASGEVHYADGEYRFVVRDIAGNQVTYVIVHKSVNHFSFVNATTGDEIIDGGVVNDANVNFSSTDGSRIAYVVRNGELITDFNSNTFTMTGYYEVLIEDAIGNRSYKAFTIINNDLATFDYVAPFEYEVTEVWRVDADGTRELLNYRGPSIHLDQNGDYLVIVSSTKTNSSFNFSVTINNAPPTAALVGAEDGQVTARDVSLSGLRYGDVVKIYRDGELVSTTTITLSTESPKITSGGKYRITITNLQGVTVEYNFVRKAVTNVAGSIFLIATGVLAIVGLGIGLAYHTRLKTDE